MSNYGFGTQITMSDIIASSNRKEAWDKIHNKENDRRRVVLEVLSDKEMTVSEMVQALIEDGILKYPDRNYVAPRVNELKEMGVLVSAGKRASLYSGRMETVWKRAEIW